jgi:membrane peptidoglycan carboxypeptidase
MLPNPRYYNPFKRMEKARDRQERVLFNMQQAKLITPEEYAAAQSTPIKLRPEGAGTLYLVGSETKNGRPCYQHALEQVLANVFSERDLHRSGKTIKTTLDKSLQNELSSSETTSLGKAIDDASHSLLVVKERGQIRAMLCDTNREQSIREMLESRGPAYYGYDVSVVSPQAITREQIVLPAENEAK